MKLLLEQTKFPSSAIEGIVKLKGVVELTPLMLACKNMHSKTYEKIKCILDIYPKASLACSKTEATTLHFSAGAGASKGVIYLIYESWKESLNFFTLKGSTPLHWDASDPPPTDYSETINAFFDIGADANTCSKCDIPTLIFALVSSTVAHAKLLAERGVELGADRGVTLSGSVKVFQIAADLNLKNSFAAMLELDAHKPKGEDTINDNFLQMKNAKDETPLDLAANVETLNASSF